jgi:HEAT repeats
LIPIGASAGSRLRAVAAACAALCALAAGCSGRSDPIHVRSVELGEGSLSPALREAGLDEPALVEAARAAIRAAGFEVGQGSLPHRAVMGIPSVQLLPPGVLGGAPRAEAAVELALVPDARGIPRRTEVATASVPFVPGRPRDAWLSAVAEAARRAAEGLALAVAAEEKPSAELIADLGAKDGRVREQAVRVLGERKVRAAVPALVERLEQDDGRLAQRIVAALAQIGDERAVGPLIDLSRGSDATVTARLARLIGDIGGAEAEGYLLTLASGHPDARVRATARKALDEMSARAKETPVAARK